MAAPTFHGAGAGQVSTTTLITFFLTGIASVAVGDCVVCQVFADGTTAETLTIDGPSTVGVEDLAGTDSAMTLITGSPFDVGSAVAGRQWLWIGRSTTATVGDLGVRVTGSGSNDFYGRLYVFKDVNAGTTLADVIENGSAGTALNGAATSGTVADTGVTTLGTDRLACNFIAVGDDNQAALTAMTGETGGDWVYPVAAFGSSTGTDGAIALVTAAMASAGTISGGTDAMTSDPWGVVGFALIGTTAAVFVPRHPAVNFQDPGIL